MPPRVKVTKEAIVNAAVDIVRRDGVQGLNARTVASVLQCSTQPVFSNFATMEDLQQATLTAAYEVYLNFLKQEAERGEYPQYKSFGMAYVRFAKEEKELFKFLFMCDREGKGLTPTPDFDASVKMIIKSNGISRERATLMHLEMWTCVHGIGTMLATSFLSLEWDLVSTMLTDVYQGVRARHLMEESGNVCHTN